MKEVSRIHSKIVCIIIYEILSSMAPLLEVRMVRRNYLKILRIIHEIVFPIFTLVDLFMVSPLTFKVSKNLS